MCKQRTERNTKDQERIISREEVDNRDADWEVIAWRRGGVGWKAMRYCRKTGSEEQARQHLLISQQHAGGAIIMDAIAKWAIKAGLRLGCPQPEEWESTSTHINDNLKPGECTVKLRDAKDAQDEASGKSLTQVREGLQRQNLHKSEGLVGIQDRGLPVRIKWNK